MNRSFISMLALGALSMVAFAAENEAGAEATEKKSIVPSKYAGKYKDGGDAVARFIKEQSSGKEGFEFPAFFQLCRNNGIPEEKVAHYEGLVNAKERGAEGRARMTLGNMLRARARKDQGLKGIEGDVAHPLEVAKAPVTGAAAVAQAQGGDVANGTADDSDENENDQEDAA